MTCYVPSGEWNIHSVPIYNPTTAVKTVNILISDQNGAVQMIHVLLNPKSYQLFDARYTYALLDEN